MTEVEQLVLSAIRGGIGDWVYYLSSMKMKEIAIRVQPAQTFSDIERLDDHLQRVLEDARVLDIKEYLLTQNQRFFNSIVIGSYGGNPKWDAIDIEPINPSIYEMPDNFSGALGLLILDGSEKMFAIDGQHRVEGIKLAVAENAEIGEEEVGVIFVQGVSGENKEEDKPGFIRTRRLFTTLNKYGKKVSKRDIIALDEDDVIAITTRKLVDEHRLFAGNNIGLGANQSIPPSDLNSFTSIRALYAGLDLYYQIGTKKAWDKSKAFRPIDDELDSYYSRAVSLWDSFIRHSSIVRDYVNSEVLTNRAYAYRNEEGGHILFRPIGLLMGLKVIRLLTEQNSIEPDEAVRILMNAQMDISEPPWVHLIWNPNNHTMIAASKNRRAAEKILAYSLGIDLAVYNTSEEELIQDIANIRNISASDVELETYYRPG